MNPRATIALLLATLLLVGGVVLLRTKVATTREAADLRRYAVAFDPEDISAITIVRGSETVALRRDGADWRIEAPVADRASPEAVDRLLLGARFLEVRDRQPADDPSSLPERGLSSPRARIDLRGENDIRVDLGADTVIPGEIYARVGGQKSVLRVPDTIVGPAIAPAESFRDPRLTDLVSDDIEKFTVRRNDGEMTLRRERGRWMIDKPVRAPADPRAVREFLEPLLGLRVTGFGPAAGAPPDAALLPGETAAISLTPRGGGEALELEVMRSGSAEGKTVPARMASRGGDVQVDAEALRLFDVSPEALRDRSLGSVDPDTVDRIRVESGGRAQLLQRQGDAWVDRESGRALDAGAVERLVGTFNAARVTTFRTAATPAETGLENPVRRLAFLAWLSENTAEESAGGHAIAGVDLGAPAPGGGIYARVAGSDETVTLPPDLSFLIDALFAPDQPEPR